MRTCPSVALVGKGDIAGAVREFQEEEVRLGPGDAKAKSNLGLALLSTGNTKAAVGALRAATEAEPSSPLDHYRLGLALASDQQLTPAVAEFRMALDLRPDYPEALNDLGVTLPSPGKFDKAIEQFRRALQIRPNYAEARDNLGLAYLSKGDSIGAAGGVSRGAPSEA